MRWLVAVAIGAVVCLLFVSAPDARQRLRPDAQTSVVEAPREVEQAVAVPELPKGMGRVVDETGAPMGGATVSIHADHNAGKPMERLQTDHEGHFRLPIGEERIAVVRADGYGTVAARPSSEPTITLAREFVVTGRVTNEAGTPMQAEIRTDPALDDEYTVDYFLSRTLWSETDGTFRIDGIALGSVELRFSHDDHIPATKSWVPGDGPLQITMIRSRTLRGVVLDPHGTPVPKAVVIEAEKFFPGGEDGAFRGTVAHTNHAGRFEWTNQRPRLVRLLAVANGLASRPVEVDLAAESSISLLLDPARIVRSYLLVRVRDPDDKPRKGIRLQWTERRWLPRGVRLDRHGVALLPPQPRKLLFYSGHGSITQAPPSSDKDGLLLLTLPEPPGTPIRIQNVTVDSSNHLPGSAEATTQPTPDHKPITLRIRRGVLRRLILRNRDGRDASFGLRLRGPAIQKAESGPGVTYLLDPNERYRVEFDDGLILYEILATNWLPPASDLPSEFHTAWPDRKREQDHVLTGRVVDSDGAPLAGVRVQRTGHWTSPGPRITRRDGSFRIRIYGDRALLQFERAGYAVARREWRAPDANWSEPLQMGRAGRVRIRIDTPSNWRPIDWRLDVRAEGWAESRKYELSPHNRRRFRISRSLHVGQIGEDEAPWNQHLTVESGAEGVLGDLPEGTAELRLWTDGYERRLRVDVRTGDTPTLATFDLH